LARHSAKNLTVVCGSAACPAKGSAIQELLTQKKIKKLITSNVGDNPAIIDLFKKGQLEVVLEAMGTLAEKVRSGGYGIPAFYSHIGVGTFLEEGGVPTKYSADGKVILSVNLAKEKRDFKGKEFLLEKTLLGDFSLVKAWKADTKGNCILKQAQRNFNPDMAIAGKVCIVEADEICEAGAFDGDDIHLPGIFVHKVIKSCQAPTSAGSCTMMACPLGTGAVKKVREMMVKRAAEEIKIGAYVVLGNGLPKAVEQFMKADKDAHIVCPETGIFGALSTAHDAKKVCTGELVDGCYNPVKLRKHAAIAKTSDTFASIRGGHLDLFVVDGFQVSENGDLANLEKGDKVFPSPGVNMDLAGTSTRLVTLMEMQTNGKPNLLPNCTYKITGKKCVSMLITDMGVFEFRADGLTLTELAPGATADKIKSMTPCKFKVASNLKTIKA
jgi:3-oxoacid CoA-transferase